MDNKSIIKALRKVSALMELHGENPFKTRGYTNAVFTIERTETRLAELSQEELEGMEGIGKSLAKSIAALIETGEMPVLQEYLDQTPAGVVEMLDIKGIGPKKIRTIWQELGIETTAGLLQACEEGQIAKLKGFGEKTQETIRQALLFTAAMAGKYHYAEVEDNAAALLKELREALGTDKIELVGDMRRYMEIIEDLRLLVATEDIPSAFAKAATLDAIKVDEVISGPFVLRGTWVTMDLPFTLFACPEARFGSELVRHTGSGRHLAAEVKENLSLMAYATGNDHSTEAEVYKALEMDTIPAAMREGLLELELAREQKLPSLVQESDLRGILHNHSTYSDGKHTLREMAEHCKELGYEYLGISDHSKSAFYANGLDEDRIIKQHKEIDELNKELAPFRIFKGIESDILADGSLDYADDVLASFDFIVSSVHSTLNMDQAKATKRLITAIENPYTTILGHPTGRLLLRREGYPIDHQAVIDACAEHGVIIEINANPWRLDLDWRWVGYALEKGVQIAINPDAHEKDGYHDMRYGLLVGQKAGLTADMTFNALGTDAVADWFEKRKERSTQKA